MQHNGTTRLFQSTGACGISILVDCLAINATHIRYNSTRREDVESFGVWTMCGPHLTFNSLDT